MKKSNLLGAPFERKVYTSAVLAIKRFQRTLVGLLHLDSSGYDLRVCLSTGVSSDRVVYLGKAIPYFGLCFFSQ